MRVQLACEFYYPSFGVVLEVTRQVAERLVGRGHSVTAATTCLPERESWGLSGVTVAEFDVSGNAVTGVLGEVEAYRQ